MECRKLEMTVVSADSLPDIRLFGQMKVYAELTITGESMSKKTPADMVGETNPRWNFSVDYWVRESAVHQADIKVAIRLFCKKTMQDDGFIGEVNIPVKRLFDRGLRADRILSYRVRGTSNGRLNISYEFGQSTVLVRRISGNGNGNGSRNRFRWRNAVEVGLLVLGGAILMLSESSNNGSNSVRAITRDVQVDEDEYEDEDEDDDRSVYYDI